MDTVSSISMYERIACATVHMERASENESENVMHEYEYTLCVHSIY